ncbi:alpha/beta hydrolase family protein [Marinomonas colpomeniae]|uniref:Lipoprotein signal peptide n=1 Tax=Marinomonas colpomeniae TaxID=2774408 RepID=A0ABR8NXW4_9GAMM|nr:alpha/beta fold hydrolase [Marinomonas colpomeniae]MBD5770870.1 lipoprotein signal peptide [Marinomonas colpomeniae]
MKWLINLILFISCWTVYASPQAVGFDQILLYGESERALKTSIWYPSKTMFPKERIADNAAFLGTDIVRIGTSSVGRFPLVMISHGYRGNWRNQNWLATKLAQQGYIVASIDHPGTSSFDHSSSTASQWWERPKDLSRLLDWLLNKSDLRPIIDATDITAIGHSLGGWTVMMLAGAEFNRDQLQQECLIKSNPRVCGLMPELGLGQHQEGEPEASLQNGRIKRVVSLDLGLARSLSRESLKSLTTPTLILAAGVDIGDLPQADESGFLAEYIPAAKRQYIIYPDAAHFSFMQLCKQGAIELLEEEEQGDGIVCQDGGARSRDTLHDVMFKDILGFIQTH